MNYNFFYFESLSRFKQDKYNALKSESLARRKNVFDGKPRR